jgi:L-serine dehydratase
MTIEKLLELTGGGILSETALAIEVEEQKRTYEDIFNEMANLYDVMEQAIHRGIADKTLSSSGFVGMNTDKLKEDAHSPLLGEVGKKAMLYALAAAEENARMGRIVAAPTAGSCGILPAVIMSIGEVYHIDRNTQVMSMFTAGAIGKTIAEFATLAGADGGCQAECGSASAMAAAAAVELLGGTPKQCAHAAALSLKFIMGLVCDPVCGLVEVPCVKRNASGAVNALTAASLALAGIESVIPCDDVISAMGKVGKSLPAELRETSKGGLAATKTGKELDKILKAR